MRRAVGELHQRPAVRERLLEGNGGGDAGEITFTPNNNFTGMGSFNYTMSDGQGAFATGLVIINVAQPLQMHSDGAKKATAPSRPNPLRRIMDRQAPRWAGNPRNIAYS